MKYLHHVSYSIIFSASLLMLGGFTSVIYAKESEIPIPSEEEPAEEVFTETEETFEEETADAEEAEINNGIPVIYLNIDESKGTIEDMNNDPDHNTYCYGTFDFTLPSPDFQYVDMDTELQEYIGLDLQIKGRGNSTWTGEKQPYKIKISPKTDLLGQGSDEKNKHWVLIANSFDPSLVKDRLTADLGVDIGMEYTPIGVPVDVVMNDTYLGSYMLMEHVRLGKGRIDIDELTEADVSEPAITGGYIVQNGLQTDPNAPGYFKTNSGIGWNIHTPSFDPDEGDYESDIQKQYIQDYFQKIEDLLFSDTQCDEQGNYYSEYMDLPSAAKYFLVQCVSRNGDSYRSGSTYLYKKRDGKLYWGPLWDFDLAWGNPGDPDDHPDEIFDYSYTDWMIAMLHDTGEGSFYQQILQEWPVIKNTLLDYSKEGGKIDAYHEEMSASQAMDATINTYDTELSYKEIIDNLKQWIIERVTWMDEHLTDLTTISKKLKLVVEGQPDKVAYYEADRSLWDLEEPEKEGYEFIGWYDESGRRVTKQDSLTTDLVLTARFAAPEELTYYEDIFFARDEITIVRNSYSMKPLPYAAFPTDAMIQTIEWSSSDLSVVTVNDMGIPIPAGIGDAVITAALPTGKSFSCLIHITDTLILPEEISIADSMEIEVGEYKRIDVKFLPSVAYVDSITYTAEGGDIITVDPNAGVVTGLKPGSTVVRIVFSYTDKDENTTTWEKFCTVIVKDTISPSHEETITVQPVTAYTCQGVPTGIDMHVKEWISMMIMSLFAASYLRKRK